MLKQLKNSFIFFAVSAAEKKADGRDITKNLDVQLDKKLGTKTSEKLQRGPLAKFLCELIEGLFSENLGDLIIYINDWQDKLESEILTGKKKGSKR